MRDDEGERAARKPPRHEIGTDLAGLSVDELKERVDLLRAEIARIETDIAAKLASRDAAGAFFRT